MSAAMLQEKNRLQSDQGIAYLFRVTIAGAPGLFRLALWDQDITFHGEVYTRFPADFDLLEEPTHAALVNLRVTVANVDQQMQSLFENYWAPVASPDWQIAVYTVFPSMPDEVPLGAGELFSVQQAVTDGVGAQFDLVADGLSLTTVLPKRRYTASNGFRLIPRRQ